MLASSFADCPSIRVGVTFSRDDIEVPAVDGNPTEVAQCDQGLSTRHNLVTHLGQVSRLLPQNLCFPSIECFVGRNLKITNT